jgi:hypothetical protein
VTNRSITLAGRGGFSNVVITQAGPTHFPGGCQHQAAPNRSHRVGCHAVVSKTGVGSPRPGNSFVSSSSRPSEVESASKATVALLFWLSKSGQP